MPSASSSRTSFRAAALQWLEESRGAVSGKTVEHYRGLLERFVFPRLEETGVREITEASVVELVASLKSAGFSDSTVYMIPRLVRRVLRLAAAEGLCPAPSWDIAMGTPEKEHGTVILTAGQAERLGEYLRENPSPRNLGLCLILRLGLSAAEVAGMTWNAVSFPRSCIHVPVSGKKVRQVPVDERLLILMKKMAGLPAYFVASGSPKPTSAAALRTALQRACSALRLPVLTPTELRYTFGVLSLENGSGFAALAVALGQDNSRNFRRFYRALVSEDTRARLEREQMAGHKPRQAPAHTAHPGPDGAPEVVALRGKVEAKKLALQAELDNLEGDLSIIRALRNADGVQGAAREGLYRFIEKVLGDDRDGRTLVEYLRSNMRVAAMPSRQSGALTPQTIRARVTRAFAKLAARLDTFSQPSEA